MKFPRLLAILLLAMIFSNEGAAAITKTEYNAVIKKLSSIYKPIVKDMGANLSIIGSWESNVLNASAERTTGTRQWDVLTFGGLARIPIINKDGFALVICHELGHHLGGYPLRKDDWASTEGQSDYFATLKCARIFFADDDNESIIKKINVPAIVTEKCSRVYTNNNEINICIRSSMASKNLALALESVRGNAAIDENFCSFDKPAPALSRVYISEKHPAAQCRLDTLFQGSLCDKNVDEKLSNTTDTNGVCSKSNGDEIGLRPACWYRVD